jgi:hypothetical protein
MAFRFGKVRPVSIPEEPLLLDQDSLAYGNNLQYAQENVTLAHVSPDCVYPGISDPNMVLQRALRERAAAEMGQAIAPLFRLHPETLTQQN